MFNSIARNNFVSNEDNGIVISESHNNEVYNNVISDSGSGIDIDEDSFENIVYNNTIINIPEPSEALYLRDGASEQNTFHSNVLIGSNGQRISLDETITPPVIDGDGVNGNSDNDNEGEEDQDENSNENE